MKKLFILAVLSVFAVGCADNLDTVPEPVNPNVSVDIDDARASTPESPVYKPKRPRLPGTTSGS
jgi:hypothetical protein